jgi:O-acetyl-ADP-ribose deacetylase (regulator of RNase III)
MIGKTESEAMTYDWDIGGCVLELTQGDITDQEVDAIVNAANSRLAGGGGVDGAIHRRGGPEIMRETDQRYPNGCSTGNAVITSAGKLNCRYVIHAVGPVWQGGTKGEAELLQAGYERCLDLALEHGCKSIAFPSLSTGAYRYPVPQASEVALSTCAEFLRRHQSPQRIRFVLFDSATLESYHRTLLRLSRKKP